MLGVTEIERAIEQLSHEEMKQLRAWLAERDAAEWNAQLEEDSQSGRLDSLIDEAIEDERQGRCTDL